MSTPSPSFTDFPLWRRVYTGAALGVGGLSPAVLIVWGMAACDGRYQRVSAVGAVEWDMWVLSATYPLGLAAAGAVAGALSRYARRLWQAGAVGVAAGLAAVYLIGLAADRRAPGGWRADWGTTWVVAVLVGGGVGIVVHRELAARRAGGAPPSAPGAA